MNDELSPNHVAHQIVFEILVSKNFSITGNGLWPSHPEPTNPTEYAMIENGCVWYSRYYGGGVFNAAFVFAIYDEHKFAIIDSTRPAPVASRDNHAVYFDLHDPALYDQIWVAMAEIFSRMQTDRRKGRDLLC